MGKFGQVVSGSVAAASLTGTVYVAANAYEALQDYQDSEALRAAAAEKKDIEMHKVYGGKVMDNAASLVVNSLGTIALGGLTISSFWGIYETRQNKPTNIYPIQGKHVRLD